MFYDRLLCGCLPWLSVSLVAWSLACPWLLQFVAVLQQLIKPKTQQVPPQLSRPLSHSLFRSLYQH